MSVTRLQQPGRTTVTAFSDDLHWNFVQEVAQNPPPSPPRPHCRMALGSNSSNGARTVHETRFIPRLLNRSQSAHGNQSIVLSVDNKLKLLFMCFGICRSPRNALKISSHSPTLARLPAVALTRAAKAPHFTIITFPIPQKPRSLPRSGGKISWWNQDTVWTNEMVLVPKRDMKGECKYNTRVSAAFAATLHEIASQDSQENRLSSRTLHIDMCHNLKWGI